MEIDNGMQNKSSKLSLPIAIVVAGVLIAGAILITKMPPAPQAANAPEAPRGDIDKLAPITQDDHILGASPETKVYVVEFSDIDCPFCKRFHPTMHQVVDEYKGKVAWVYRHFPLDSIHPNARKKAEATECAAALGGNFGFWKYLDKIMEITPEGSQLDQAELYNIAKDTGLDEDAFEKCLDGGKYAPKVEAQYQDGLGVGVSGTPMSIIVYKDKKVILEGAQPVEAIKAKIDALLK